MSRRHLAPLQHWDWNFECGAALNVTEESGNIRIAPRLDWSSTWGHFAIRFDRLGGKTPKFVIDKATRWIGPITNGTTENSGIWSTALDTDDWHVFDNQVSSGSNVELWNNSPFPNGSIYVAHMALYPVSRLLRKYSEWRTKDARIVPIAVGQDIRRPNGDGRVAAAYPFIGFKITNPSGYSKNKIVLTAGNHPSEYHGMFQMEGAIEFLLSGEPEAEFLLDWADIWIYPMLNPQGIGGGWFRCSPNTSTDNNRLWNGSGVSTSVDAFKTSFASELGASIDVGLDMHGALGNSQHYQSCADHTQPENVWWDSKMEILLGSLYGYAYSDETVVSMLRELFTTTYSAIFPVSTENTHLRTHVQPTEFKTMGANIPKILPSMIGGRLFTYGPDVGSRSFNGTTDRIDWTSPWTPTNGGAFSASLWIYWTSTPTNGYLLCVHDSGDTSYGLVINYSSATINYIRRWSTTSYMPYKGYTLVPDKWVHIGIAHNGGNALSDTKFYFDGLEYTTSLGNTGAGTEYTHSGSWSLGGRIYDDTRCHPGRIAQAGIWNVQLTAGEMKRLALGLAPDLIQNSNLKFYFRGDTSSLVASPGGTGVADGTTHVSGVGNGPGIIYG